MPTFRVEDDNGNTLTLEGDSEPTEQELEDIFSSRQSAPGAPATSFAPPEPSESLIPDFIGGQPSFLTSPPPMAATPREEALASLERRGPSFEPLPADFVAEQIPDPSRQPQPGAMSRLATEFSTAPIGLGAFSKRDGRTIAPGSVESPPEVTPSGMMPTRVGSPTAAFISALPEGKIKDLSAGAYNAAANLFNFFLSPAGVASLGIGSLPAIPQRALAAKFAYDMATGAPEQLAAGDEAMKRGDIQGATQHWLGGVASLGLAGLAAGQAVSSINLPAIERRAPPIIQEVVDTGQPPPRVPRAELPEVTAEEVSPDTQLQPGVPREGISAEVAKPVKIAQVTAEQVARNNPVLNEWNVKLRRAMAEEEMVKELGNKELIAAAEEKRRAIEDERFQRLGTYATDIGIHEAIAERLEAGTHEWIDGFGLRKKGQPEASTATTIKPTEVDTKLINEPKAGPEFIKSESTVDLNAVEGKMAKENDLPALQKMAAEAIGDRSEITSEFLKKVATLKEEGKVPTEDDMRAYFEANLAAGVKLQNISDAIAKQTGANPATEPTSASAAKEAAPPTAQPASPLVEGTPEAGVAAESVRQENLRKQALREVERQKAVGAKSAQTAVSTASAEAPVFNLVGKSKLSDTDVLELHGDFFRENPVGATVKFRWPEGGDTTGKVVGHSRSGALQLSVKEKGSEPIWVSETQILKPSTQPEKSRDQLIQEERVSAIASLEEQAVDIKRRRKEVRAEFKGVKPVSPMNRTTPNIERGQKFQSALSALEIEEADVARHLSKLRQEQQATDWTSATEDVAETAPEPGKTEPPPDPNIIEMGAGIPIPKFANRKMSPLDRVTTSHSGKLQKSFSEARLAQNEIKKAVPSEKKRNAISVYREAAGDMAVLKDWETRAKQKWMRDAARDAQALTAKEAALLPKVASAYSTMETRGNTYDVLRSHRDNYVTHIWDVKRPGSGFGTGMLKQRFRFAKARTFNTFFEGDQAGFKPKTLDISKLLPAYIHEMNRVIADRQAVRDLAKGTMADGSPMVVPKGNVKVVDGPKGKAVLVSPKAMRVADTSDYRVMADQPALANWIWEGKDTDGKPVFVNADLAVHPDVFRRLTAILGQSAIRTWYRDPVTGTAQIPRAIVRGLDTAQAAMKREMFGLLAPFHQVQEGTHAIGHLVNPFFGLEKIDLVKNSKMADAANHGLMLLPDRASSRVYLEGVGAKSSLLSQGLRKAGKATAGVGEAIADVIDGYQDYLFHQYIPALKFKTYEAMLARNTKLYAKELASGEMTESDIKLTSAEQANSAYGHLNYALLGRNPTIQHLIQLSALAPDFLEARARFAGQGVKGLRSKVGHEQLKAIAILAAAQAGMAFVLSQLLGVDYDEKHPFEVVYQGRRYALRSVPEDIFGLMKDTRRFVYSRVNPLTVKTGVQLATGLNYRGEKVGALDTMEELLAGYIPITARSIPGIRSLTETGRNNPVSPLQQLAGSLGLRISRYSPISETYKNAAKWMDAQKLPRDTGSYPVSKYQQLRYALEDGDIDRAATAYAELRKTMTPDKIEGGFKESVSHPFTKSQAMDAKFAASLSGYDKELYQQAIRTRATILNAFYKVPKK